MREYEVSMTPIPQYLRFFPYTGKYESLKTRILAFLEINFSEKVLSVLLQVFKRDQRNPVGMVNHARLPTSSK